MRYCSIGAIFAGAIFAGATFGCGVVASCAIDGFAVPRHAVPSTTSSAKLLIAKPLIAKSTTFFLRIVFPPENGPIPVRQIQSIDLNEDADRTWTLSPRAASMLFHRFR